jgi:hypothetical protein
MIVKLQYLLPGAIDEPIAAFKRRMVEEVGPRLLAGDPQKLKLTYTAAAPPRISIVPLRRDRIALASIWTVEEAGEAERRWTERVAALNFLGAAGYRVEESCPRSYPRDWPDGRETPGAGLLTLLNRKRGLDEAEFFRRWFEGHATLSLEMLPLWNYVRNVVRGTIVEEHFREADDLLRPDRFFGGPLRMLPNMLRLGRDIWGFLDLVSLRSYLVEELWLRS